MTHDTSKRPVIPAPELAGRVLYRLAPIRRRVVLENLRHVFSPVLSEEEIRRLAQAHYAHQWRCLVEMFDWIIGRRYIQIRVESSQAARRLDPHAGTLLLMAHVGNFELVPLAGLRAAPQLRGLIHVIRRPLPFRWLDRLVHRLARAAGGGIISDRGASRIVEETLARGESVGFVLDQHAAWHYGVTVDFLGQPASTFRSLAEFSLRLDRPVVPFLSWREMSDTHAVHVGEPIYPVQNDDFETAVRAMTQVYNDVLAAFILAHPEQWFWMHRRWKASLAAHRRHQNRPAERQAAPAQPDGNAPDPCRWEGTSDGR